MQIQSGQIEEYDGDLDFRSSLIVSLGNLKHVTGEFILDYAEKLKSLGKLEYVGGCLYLDNTQIETLGNVEFIGGNFTALNTLLKNLGKIKKIEGDIGLTNTPNLSWGTIPRHLWSKISGVSF